MASGRRPPSPPKGEGTSGRTGRLCRARPLRIRRLRPPTSPSLTTDEAAAYLRTTRGTVYNLVWKGALPRRGKLLFTRPELDAYLAGKGGP
ncbi:MAG: helix-turn-helix domain-containing protein [Gemmataceae bacterium]|nr:helix-turn-helix domain-containing protein [Gemmataceae bacterium]